MAGAVRPAVFQLKPESVLYCGHRNAAPGQTVPRRDAWDAMDVATADKQTDFQAQHPRRAAGLLRQDFQVRHGAFVGGPPRAGHQGAGVEMRPGRVEIQRRQEVRARGGRRHHRRGGRAPGAGPGESGAARPVARHQLSVCRHPAHPAGRGCAGAPPPRFGDPLRARRRGRLYGGRGREDHHEARRLRHHGQLGRRTTTATRRTSR